MTGKKYQKALRNLDLIPVKSISACRPLYVYYQARGLSDRLVFAGTVDGLGKTSVIDVGLFHNALDYWAERSTREKPSKQGWPHPPNNQLHFTIEPYGDYVSKKSDSNWFETNVLAKLIKVDAISVSRKQRWLENG